MKAVYAGHDLWLMCAMYKVFILVNADYLDKRKCYVQFYI